jgi:Flp pilus assembly protein TadG
MTRQHDDRGLTSTELAVLMPALIFWIMLTVQYGLWFHARQVAGAAAAEAVDAAQVPDGTADGGERAARSFLAQSGNLDDIRVAVNRTTETVSVEITGQAPQLVPGISWSVTATAESPVERFIEQSDR